MFEVVCLRTVKIEFQLNNKYLFRINMSQMMHDKETRKGSKGKPKVYFLLNQWPQCILCYYNRILETGLFIKDRDLFLIALEAWKSKVSGLISCHPMADRQRESTRAKYIKSAASSPSL